MNKKFALHNYALEVFSKYDFKDYQTHVYNDDDIYDDNYTIFHHIKRKDMIYYIGSYFSIVEQIREDIINHILKTFTKEYNYNRIVDKKTTYLFAQTRTQKNIIFAKFEEHKNNLKVSLLLKDKIEIDNYLHDKEEIKQDFTNENFYKKFFKNLDKEIKKLFYFRFPFVYKKEKLHSFSNLTNNTKKEVNIC